MTKLFSITGNPYKYYIINNVSNSLIGKLHNPNLYSRLNYLIQKNKNTEIKHLLVKEKLWTK